MKVVKPMEMPIEPSPEPRKSLTQPTSQKEQLLKSEPIEAVTPIEEEKEDVEKNMVPHLSRQRSPELFRSDIVHN